MGENKLIMGEGKNNGGLIRMGTMYFTEQELENSCTNTPCPNSLIWKYIIPAPKKKLLKKLRKRKNTH